MSQSISQIYAMVEYRKAGISLPLAVVVFMILYLNMIVEMMVLYG